MGKYEGCGKGRVQRLQQTESENEKERVYLLDASIRAEGRSSVRVEVQRLRQGHWRGSPQCVDAFETGPGVERTKRQPPKCRRRGYLNVGNYGPGDLIVSSDDKT